MSPGKKRSPGDPSAGSETPAKSGAALGAEPWWDFPIRSNPLLGAYKAGRLANQFGWHAVQGLLLYRSNHVAITAEVFARLEALMIELVPDDNELLKDRLRPAREGWEATIGCEDAAEDRAALGYPEEFQATHSANYSMYDEYQFLVRRWIEPRTRDLHECIREPLGPEQRRAYNLGYCLDQGLRPPDVYRFMYRPTDDAEPSSAPSTGEQAAESRRAESETADEELPSPTRGKLLLGWWPNYSPAPGELEWQDSWPHKLATLCQEVGISDVVTTSCRESRKACTAEERVKIIAETDKGLRKELTKAIKKQPWCHAATDKPPPEFQFGPLRGQPSIVTQFLPAFRPLP